MNDGQLQGCYKETVELFPLDHPKVDNIWRLVNQKIGQKHGEPPARHTWYLDVPGSFGGRVLETLSGFIGESDVWQWMF